MRHAIIFNSSLLILHALAASPFTPSPSLECVVYSDSKSDQPLHVEQWTTNGTRTGRSWVFPSSYSGHRAVCRLPGASTNDMTVAWFGGDSYEPGNMFGVSGTAYGYYNGINNPSNYGHEAGICWPSVSTTALSPICPRIKIWEDSSDRGIKIDDESYFEFGSRGNHKPAGPTTSGTNIIQPGEIGDSVRVRVVRYAVNGFFTYSFGLNNRVVFDETFRRGERDFLCEADFLSEGELDLDWATLKDEVAAPIANNYHVTNISYLVVIGDGPCGFDRYNATNESDRVTALKTIITRRFDNEWKSPVLTGVDHLTKGNHPVFSWRMPDESSYARKFGSSYTAFRLQIVLGGSTGGEGGKLVLTTDVIRAPRQRTDGNFVWTAPFSVGDSSYLGSIFNSNTNFSWRVSMYNSRFKPMQSISGDTWSAVGYFVTHHQD